MLLYKFLSELHDVKPKINKDELSAFIDAFDIDVFVDSEISNTAEITAKLLEITEDGNQSALLLNALSDGAFDISTENWRLINAENIDSILAEELSYDTYILGCFSAWAISDATGWPVALIEAAQKGEAFSEIGEAMTTEQVKELARVYVSSDGYGHHFASYDGVTHEIITRDSAGAAADLYYLFRTN